MLTWTIKPENRDASLKRLQSIDNIATEGIKILGHWHNVNLLGGWALVEADSEASIARWLMDWTDLNVNDVTLVVDMDEVLSLK